MSNLTGKRWDIFCRIVDNFGDIGVCWRLSQQLVLEHQLRVRLFIDDFTAASKIIPQLNISKQSQLVNDVEICTWPAPEIIPADVVIETFACALPDAYMQQMQVSKSVWINLEYLSAETWVGDFHARPSPHASLALTKYYYFPGFRDDTGGLIREANIADKTACHSDFHVNAKYEDALKISLFCYSHAPIHHLLTALQVCNHEVLLLVPQSSILPEIARLFGKASLEAGETLIRGNLNLQVLPFLSQADYDKLLRACDLNFVRGEDSWVRAIWAGKPFIWQPYLQSENTHLKKLNAFLAFFYQNFEQKQIPWEAHQYWSTEDRPAKQVENDTWQRYLGLLPAIKTYTQTQSRQLAAQPDLAAKLVIFCNKL